MDKELEKRFSRNLGAARFYYVQALLMNGFQDSYSCARYAVDKALLNDTYVLNTAKLDVDEDDYERLILWFLKYTMVACNLVEDMKIGKRKTSSQLPELIPV